jgi:hypothetical protein
MPFAGRLAQFLRLVMRHGRVAASAWPRLAQWLALCVTLQWAVRRDWQLYEAAIAHIDVPDDPLFVLGHWRSGTTYLHYLLALDRENFAYPSNYQCLFPTVFLTLGEGSWLYRRLASRLPPTRPMDRVAWDLAAPQEDELVYLTEGGSNPFHESMLFPLTARVDAEAFLRQSSDTRTREITLRFFRKLTFVHGRRLVAKSPGHLFRLPMLRALFPRSRVIFIVRDPYEVVPSMEHMKAMFRQHMSLQGPHIVDHVATSRLLALYFAVMHERLAELPAADHALVRYEDLLRDPIRTVQGLYDHLGLPYSAAYHRALIAYADAAREHEPNRFTLSPSARALVEVECGEILARYGFGRRNSAA